VADHVAQRDAVPLSEPQGQPERCGELARVVEDLGVARPDVLDPDRRPVEPDRVAADRGERDELVDRPVGVDQEVRARPGQLVQLGVGRVGAEGGDRGRRGRRGGVVLDDHARVFQAPRVQAVVPGRVRGRLGPPVRGERDGPLDDVRLRREQERRGEEQRHHSGKE
jgi:hypothetical protein